MKKHLELIVKYIPVFLPLWFISAVVRPVDDVARPVRDTLWSTVEMASFKLENGLKVITDEEALIDVMKQPNDTLLYDASNMKEVWAYNPEGTLLDSNDEAFMYPFPQAGFRYDSLFFSIREGYAYLNEVQFEKHPEIKVLHPDITLSVNTTLKDIKRVFPKSYASRNIGNSTYRGSFIQNKPVANFDFVKIGDYRGLDTSEPMWTMELAFIDEKLVYISLSKLTHKI